MSEPICADCGQPIMAEHYDLMCDGTARHELLRECVGALKRALSASESDRDRYRAVQVSLRDAERAYTKARAARNAAYRASRGCATTEFIEAARVCNAAGDALDAAIAAVEEGR